MTYYYIAEIDLIWKQNDLFGNPSSEYKMYILSKDEAQELSDSIGTKIVKLKINSKQIKMAKDKKAKKEKKEKKSKEKDAPKTTTSSGETTSYTGSIALSKLEHVRMKMKGKKGKVDCIVIPIDKNFLTKGDEGAVYLNLRLRTTADQDKYGQNGFIAHSADSKMYKEAKDKDKEKMSSLPILGNIKNWDSGSASSSNDAGGSKGEIDETDDLPF